jgi:hypothetical protein
LEWLIFIFFTLHHRLVAEKMEERKNMENKKKFGTFHHLMSIFM